MRYFIIGAGGQDGQIAVEKLLQRGAEVITYSKALQHSILDSSRTVRKAYLSTEISLSYALAESAPDFILHLGGVHQSSQIPISDSLMTKEMHTVHVEYTMQIINYQIENPNSRSVIALSAHMFPAQQFPLKIVETTLPKPINEYGKTKLEAWTLLTKARQHYDVCISGALLFNHTSSLSKKHFLFPTLAQQFCEVLLGKRKKLQLDNLDIRIDITDAYEIVTAMLLMLETSTPADYILSSDRSPLLRDCVSKVSSKLGLEMTIIADDPKTILNSGHFGDASKVNLELGWQAKVNADELLFRMVQHQRYPL